MPARKPEECHTLFAQALNAHDLDMLTALYEPEATLIPARGAAAVTGTKAIREALRGFTAMKPRIELKTVFMLESGGIALLRGRWRLTRAALDGPAEEVTGNSTEVVRRQADGTWRYLIDHPNGAD